MQSPVSQIELRLSQTHGPYLCASEEVSDALGMLFAVSDLLFARKQHGEVGFIPAGLSAIIFGDADRDEVAKVLKEAGTEVILADPDPPVYRSLVAEIFELEPKWDWMITPDEWKLPVAGLSTNDAEELLRMATDTDLRTGSPRKAITMARWHAWRALALLKVEAALEPLATHLDRIDWSPGFDDDKEEGEMEWSLEEIAPVFAAFGPMAGSVLEARLKDTARRPEVRTGTIECLKQIGQYSPNGREAVCPLLHRALEGFAENQPEVNGSLVSALTRLRAKESLPLIKAAFAADTVDEMYIGDWEDIQIKFGLISRRTKAPRPNKLSLMRDEMLKSMNNYQLSKPSSATRLPKPAKTGRNDPCPCGSSKKFKKCCG